MGNYIRCGGERGRGLHNPANEETCGDSSDSNRSFLSSRRGIKRMVSFNQRENNFFGNFYTYILLLTNYFTEVYEYNFPSFRGINGKLPLFHPKNLYPSSLRDFRIKLLVSSLKKKEIIIKGRGKEIPHRDTPTARRI